MNSPRSRVGTVISEPVCASVSGLLSLRFEDSEHYERLTSRLLGEVGDRRFPTHVLVLFPFPAQLQQRKGAVRGEKCRGDGRHCRVVLLSHRAAAALPRHCCTISPRTIAPMSRKGGPWQARVGRVTQKWARSHRYAPATTGTAAPPPSQRITATAAHYRHRTALPPPHRTTAYAPHYRQPTAAATAGRHRTTASHHNTCHAHLRCCWRGLSHSHSSRTASLLGEEKRG